MNVNITATNHAKSNLGRWMRLLTWTTVLAVLAGVLPLQPGMAGIASNGGSFANDGARLLANPTGARYVTASVNSLVADIPRGKIYVGGDLSGVSDASTLINRMNLARLNSDGTVDASFVVTTADEVRTMLPVDDFLYVGGDFSDGGSEDSRDSGGAFRSDQALRLNRSTGLIDRAWVPSSLSNVYSMAYVTGTTNYLVAGMSGSGYLKALNVITGSTYVTISDYDDTVRALLWDGNYLYVGGEQFGTNGKPDYLRRYTFDGATFTYDTVWQPTVANSGLFDNWVRAMLIHDGYLYVAGEFNDVAGMDDYDYLVRIPLTDTTGAIDRGWKSGMMDSTYALASGGGLLYSGGEKDERYVAGRYRFVDGMPIRDEAWMPVPSFVQTTGTPLAPSSDDYADVFAMLPLTDTVLIGGDFASMNGVQRNGLAMVDSDGTVVPDAPTITAPTGSGRGPYTFSGTAQDGVRVTLYDGSAIVSSTIVVGGVWSFTTGNKLAVGEHVFTARASAPYSVGLPTLLPGADAAYTLTVSGALPATGLTYASVFTGSGTDGALYLNSDQAGNLLNVYDPTILTPLDSSNSRPFSTSGAVAVNSAKLLVTAYDIDWSEGEWDYIYLNGHELGRLSGTSNTWNVTEFDIPDLSWIVDGANILQFKTTHFGETYNDVWAASITTTALLIDGGAGDKGTLLTLTVPQPVNGVITPTSVFTNADEAYYRVEHQLLDPNGDAVASSASSDILMTLPDYYTYTAPMTYTASSYTGYSVRAMLYALVDTVWMPQGSLQTYFDVAETVGKAGTGSGTVTSTPAGIACGVTCTAYFDYASVLTYTATPITGSKFIGWSGACSGTGVCVVTLTAELPVTATFELKSTDAYLTALNLSAGTPSPAVVSTTTSYTASVAYEHASVQLTPTLSSANATYTITTASGPCAGNVCALAVGSNAITITVTAEDGTTRDYVIDVTRRPSTDAYLTALGLSAGTPSPTVVSTTTSYTADVTNSVASLVLTPTLSSANATYTITTASGPCGGNACALAVGSNAITITVTAEDGTTTRHYVLVVTRAAGPSTPTPTPTDTSTPTGTPTLTSTPTPTSTSTPTDTPTPTSTPGPLAIGNVWPRTSLPAGGMPVSLFGSGFSSALTVTVGGSALTFTVVSDGRIDFIMPPGVAGTTVSVTVETVDAAVSLADAYQ